MALVFNEQVILNKDKLRLLVLIMVTGNRDLMLAVQNTIAYNYTVTIVSFKSSICKTNILKWTNNDKLKIYNIYF